MKSDKILARAFATATDEEQAGMINHLARELFVSCRGRYGFTTQCCALSAYLDKDGLALIKELHGFVELREEEI